MKLFGIVLGCVLSLPSAKPEAHIIAIDDAGLVMAPYVWKQSGKGNTGHAEAAMPGAYLRATFQSSTSVGLVVDGTANRGCPASSMPVIEYSIDEGEFKVGPLTRTEFNYTLDLFQGLDAAKPHRVEVVFRAADLLQDRWESSKAHLRVTGIALDQGGVLLPSPRRPKKAIGFGDSITEGVGADGLFTSWQSLGVNNARATWFPIVCAALDCEFGQLGSGGLGMTRTLNLPPLPRVWDHHDSATSRLIGGSLLPEPDYVFCSLGTNDFDKDITIDYTDWLITVRRACPNTRIFCVVPPLQVHRTEIQAAVASRNQARDRRVYLIETARLASGFRSGQGATQLGHDGVHPSQFGHAMLAAIIGDQVRAVLDRERKQEHPAVSGAAGVVAPARL
jgi:lysophospholipase L1-like esterase